MTKCIVHIGMHKTGSTSIQQSFNHFSDRDFYYANLGKVSNHSLAMYSMFADCPEKHHIHKARMLDEGSIAEYIAEVQFDLKQSIVNAANRTLVISGEDITALSATELKRLREYLSASFENILVVGYVRPPGAFISSAFQERVKGGATGGFDLYKEYRNYETSFAKFDEVFGQENVQLWKFTPDTFPGGCVVRDFCKRLNIAFPVERIVRFNESFPRAVVSILYNYAKFAKTLGLEKMTGPDGQRLGKVLQDVDDCKFRFSPTIIKPILEKNRNDIEWMESRLGYTLTEDLGLDKSGDIGSEEDLLTLDPRSVGKILRLLGDSVPDGNNAETPEEVAFLVHALRQKLCGHRGVARQDKGIIEKKANLKESADRLLEHVKISDLIEHISQANPELIADFPKGNAEALLRKVFQQISHILLTKDEGLVQFVGLGLFRIKKVERNIGGDKVVHSHIIFRKANVGQKVDHPENLNNSTKSFMGSRGVKKA